MTNYTIEAEDLNLDGYEARTHSVAANHSSGDGFIQSWGGGSASGTFEGDAGRYLIDLTVFDENDGASTVELVVNGEVVAVLIMDEDAGGNWIADTLTRFSLVEVDLQPGDSFELRATSDHGEPARIDKIDFTSVSTDDAVPSGPATVIYSEDFQGAADSGDFNQSNGGLTTNGRADGGYQSDLIEMDGKVNGVITMDLGITYGWFEEWGGQWGDYFSVELIDQNGTVHVLDVFSGSGNTLVGSRSGQEITKGGLDGFTYEVPEGVTSFTIQLQSDISARCEEILIDNIVVMASEPEAPLAIDAVDDIYVVQESEDEGDVEGNVLDNDTSDFGPVTKVFSVEGQTANVGEFIELAGGGRVRIDENGNLDFDADGDFDFLNDGESATVSLDYTIAEVIQFDKEYQCLGFQNLAAGTIVEDQYASAGLRVSSANPNNPVMVFDTSNPTGGDFDLATTNMRNVLILSEDGNSANPDDNAGGGTFIFDFERPAEVKSMRFLDTEEPGAEIRLYDEDGQLIKTIQGPVTADNGQAFAGIHTSGVSRMEIELQGSGAIDNLVYTLPEVNEIVAEDTATVTIIVEGENDVVVQNPPVAEDDARTINEDEAIAPGTSQSLNILDNDSDPDGDAISVTAVAGGAVGAAFAVTTANGVETQVRVDANGEVTFDTDGLFDTMAVGETDSFQLTYTITDGNGGFDDAVVTINILGLNEPPVATDNSAFTDEETAVSGNVITDDDGDGVDSDPNSDPLTVTEVSFGVVGTPTTVTTDSGDFTGELIVNGDGSYTFTPGDEFSVLNPGEEETVTFSYTVSDGNGGEDTADVVITIGGLNEPPVAIDDAITIFEDENVGFGGASLLVLENDSDPDGDPLTVIDVDGSAPGAPVGVTTAGGVDLEVVIQSDGTLLFDPGDALAFLNDGESDSFTVDYTASDGNGGTDDATVTVTIEGKSDDTGPDTSYNIVFLVDTSSSTGNAGSGAALLGAQSPLDLNNDGATDSLLDAQFSIVQQISDQFAATLGDGADVELGVFAMSTDLVNGQTNEASAQLADGGQSVFGAGADLTGAFDGVEARDVAAYNTGFAAANGFLSTATGNDQADAINLVYVLTDGFGADFTGGGDASLADELTTLSGFGATAETLVFDGFGAFSPQINAIENTAGDGAIQILTAEQDVDDFVATLGSSLIV